MISWLSCVRYCLVISRITCGVKVLNKALEVEAYRRVFLLLITYRICQSTNKEALTVLCSVVKRAGSGRARKKCRGNHETWSSVFPYFLSVL